MIGIAELVIILLLLAGIPWLIALIDILRSDFTGNDKLIWLLVIIFIPFIGPIVYFIVGRKQKIRTKKE
jgi:uncharacterized membrane protein